MIVNDLFLKKMSCLSIRQILRSHGLGVDDFSVKHVKQAFLTHLHQDHMASLPSFLHGRNASSRTLWCSKLTAKLLTHSFTDGAPKTPCKIIVLPYHEWKLVKPGIAVSCWPAYHCPGSVMFAFIMDHMSDHTDRSSLEKQLYVCTGDFRWCLELSDSMKWLIQSVKECTSASRLLRAHWFYDSTFAHVSKPLPTLSEASLQFYELLNRLTLEEKHNDIMIHMPRIGVEEWLLSWMVSSSSSSGRKKKPRVVPLWPENHMRFKQLQVLLGQKYLKQKQTEKDHTSERGTIYVGQARDMMNYVNNSPLNIDAKQCVLIYVSCTFSLCPEKNLEKWHQMYKHVYYIPFCTHSSAPELQQFMGTWLQLCESNGFSSVPNHTDFQPCRETEKTLSCFM